MELSLKTDLLIQTPLSHLASTKLNICAVLSQLGRHTEAKQFAKEAVQHLFEALSEFKEQQS